MTGIMGIKAYRCLNNARVVLLVLAILRTTSVGLLILGFTRLDAIRRLSGKFIRLMAMI